MAYLLLILLAVAGLLVCTWKRNAHSTGTSPVDTLQWPFSCFPRITSLIRGEEILKNVYLQQLNDNRPRTLCGVFGTYAVLPPSWLDWLISQPETRLSARWAQMDELNIPMTFLRPEIGLDPVHEPLVRRNLNAHLDLVASQASKEVSFALQDLWGLDTDGWREVNLDYTLRRIVARAANRVFVGEELCEYYLSTHLPISSNWTNRQSNSGQNTDYIEHAISYVSRVPSCGLAINLLPVWLKAMAGPVLTLPVRWAYWRCSKYLLPHFSCLVSHGSVAQKTAETSSTGLFSSWLVANSTKFPAESLERSADFLSRRILALNFASIHTTTMTTSNFLLDIFSHPTAGASLREETLHLELAQNDGSIWDRAQQSRMILLDSGLRESMRLWGLVPRAMSRKVIDRRGITLPDGTSLPRGTTVCVSGWGLHHDERLYPKPYNFAPDRFVEPAPSLDHRTSASLNIEARDRLRSPAPRKLTSRAVEASSHFVTWGIGKHACPGRFFAVDLVKIITAHILRDYEIEALAERSPNLWIEFNVVPPPAASLRVRRRKM